VPEADPSPAAQALICIALLALVAASAVLLRVIAADEPLSQRVALLAAVAAIGAALAAAAPAAALASFRIGSRAARGIAAGAAMTLLFVPATLATFAIKLRILDGRIDGDLAEEIVSGEIIYSLIGAMGMFTPTGLRYLAPWPLAVVSLASLLIFSHRPRPAPESC